MIKIIKSLKIILLTLLLVSCSNLPLVVKPVTETAITKNTVTKNSVRNNKIYIVSHGWHTGFVIPAGRITNNIKQLKQRFGDTPYIEFGWGDKGFYQTKEVTSGITVQAMLWATTAVVHVVSVPVLPKDFFIEDEVLNICLNDNEYKSLIQFISDSFKRDNMSKIIPTKKGIYGNSQFYKAVGSYYLTNTCNKWTAKGLASSGFDISPTLKLTSSSIMDYLKKEGLGKKCK